tara:strand:+ start:462448 stop:463005 length:558 start_codon:yes stop_codon:yes gene_type:complete
MKLASYTGTHSGWKGLGNILIRWRLKGAYSHSELVFMPDDGVDHLMPDGTCESIDGAYWCASSTGTDTMPEWSPRRAGKMGGVRFKRIKLDPAKWEIDECPGDANKAAHWFKAHQGRLYDWQLMVGFVAWLIPNKDGRFMCSESVAEAIGIKDAFRIDPCILKHINQVCLNVRRLAARKLKETFA